MQNSESSKHCNTRFVPLVLVAALALLASPVQSSAAEMSFRFSRDVTAYNKDETRPGTILISGDSRYRIDYDPADTVAASTSVISVDGGSSEVALNAENGTYFDPGGTHYAGLESWLLQLPPVLATASSRIVSVSVDVKEKKSGVVMDGYDAREYVVEVRYEGDVRYAGEKMKAIFEASYRVWVTEQLDVSLPGRMDLRMLRTGWSEVDSAISEHTSRIPGVSIARNLTVTRRIAGGEVFEERIQTSYTDFVKAELPESIFSVPADYEYQAPQYGM